MSYQTPVNNYYSANYQAYANSSYYYNNQAYQAYYSAYNQCNQSESFNYAYFNPVSQNTVDLSSNDAVSSEVVQQPSKKKFKKYDDIKCGICGDLSSGFHYGAYTCEACKLFFTRITKNKRKRKFELCPLKNCELNTQTRSYCCECRFKKCIAIGMSMNRSKYGRHTDESAKRNRILNINLKLVDLLLNETKPKLTQILLLNNLSSVRDIVKEFYAKSMSLLKTEDANNSSNMSSNSLSSSSNSFNGSLNHSLDLMEAGAVAPYKFMSSYADNMAQLRLNQEQLKYNSLFVLLSVLFELNISNLYYNYEFSGYKTLELKLKQLISLLEANVLGGSVFSLTLRVGCFVHVMYNLLKDGLIEEAEQSGANEGESQCQKRILDLIRSEVVGLGGELGYSSTELIQWMAQIQNILISYL